MNCIVGTNIEFIAVGSLCSRVVVLVTGTTDFERHFLLFGRAEQDTLFQDTRYKILVLFKILLYLRYFTSAFA